MKEEFTPSELENRERIENLIKERIKNKEFEIDVFDDPVSPVLEDKDVDYLNKKFSSKMKTFFANLSARMYFEKMIKDGGLIIDGIEGLDNYIEASKNGCIVTANHVHQFDNYVVLKGIEKGFKKKFQRLYRVIREGNYTDESSPFKFYFKNCNTLPLSSSKKTMISFLKAVKEILNRKQTILIYPEQSLWLNYKKPKPYKNGAFDLASRNNAPIVPIYLELRETDKKDPINPGYHLMGYTIHILKPIYPDPNKSKGENRDFMRDEAYRESKEKYEDIYKEKLTYEE